MAQRHGPSFRIPKQPRVLNPTDRLIAASVAAGAPYEAVAKQLSEVAGTTISPTQVRIWAQKARVKKKIAALQDIKDERVIEVLAAGEMFAAEWLMNCLEDETVDHKIKLEASIQLLDRMAKRGKPVERSVNTLVNVNPEDAERALKSALADPGVRRAFGLEANLKVLPARVAEEIVIGSPVKVDVVPSEDSTSQ